MRAEWYSARLVPIEACLKKSRAGFFFTLIIRRTRARAPPYSRVPAADDMLGVLRRSRVHAAPSTASSRPWHTSVVKAVSPQARRSCRFSRQPPNGSCATLTALREWMPPLAEHLNKEFRRPIRNSVRFP